MAFPWSRLVPRSSSSTVGGRPKSDTASTVIVTGAANSVTNCASLTVNEPTSGNGPNDMTLISGGTGTFSTTPSGTGPFTYQWTVFKNGAFALFDSRVWGAVAFMRQDANSTVGYLAQISEAWHKFHSVAFDITPLARAIGASQQIAVTNLLTASALRIEEQDGAFKLQPERLGVAAGTQFCFIAVSNV